MKIYTIFTPSHKALYEEYFLPTLPKADNFELITARIPQECSTGNFYDQSWYKTCLRKIDFFIKACKENPQQTFIFSDVDIQFFGPVKELLLEELGDFDIACQNDTGLHCFNSGFFICKGNERTLKTFTSMKENFKLDDQFSLNINIHLCKAKLLSEKFFTIAHITKKVWTGEEFQLPEDILMHHGNWTIGIDNKLKLLRLVREKIISRFNNNMPNIRIQKSSEEGHR